MMPVLTINSGSLAHTTIVQINSKEIHDVVFIQTESGQLILDPDKPFFNPELKIWVRASRLTPNDVFLDAYLKHLKIKSVKRITLKKSLKIYDLTLENPHTFFICDSGGHPILVHNGFWGAIGKGLKKTGKVIGKGIKKGAKKLKKSVKGVLKEIDDFAVRNDAIFRFLSIGTNPDDIHNRYNTLSGVHNLANEGRHDENNSSMYGNENNSFTQGVANAIKNNAQSVDAKEYAKTPIVVFAGAVVGGTIATAGASVVAPVVVAGVGVALVAKEIERRNELDRLDRLASKLQAEAAFGEPSEHELEKLDKIVDEVRREQYNVIQYNDNRIDIDTTKKGGGGGPGGNRPPKRKPEEEERILKERGYEGKERNSRQLIRAHKSRVKQARIHEQKIRDYKRDPANHDNKGRYKNAKTPLQRHYVKSGRLNHLMREVKLHDQEASKIREALRWLGMKI